MKKKLLALWVCALYFAILVYTNLGYATFGTLGLIRPSDTKNGMVEVSYASGLIQGFADRQQRLTWLVGLGAAALFCVSVWFTAGVKRGSRTNEH